MPNSVTTSIRKQLTCPHCWQVFATDRTLWVSESPDLLGDSRLGEAAQKRFLPVRFDAAAQAIDADGFACHRLACPNCHLEIPRPFLEMTPFFVSIVGAPAVGKSYFLASMTWQLRKIMPKYFQLTYTDADPEMNLRLQQYESQQFLQNNLDEITAIEKTEVYGDNYNTVLLKGQQVAFPQPFAFAMTPNRSHPQQDKSARISRVLCLYDNAGESYLPGEDSAVRPVTRHLGLSDAIFFLFDPTQDARFRSLCGNRSNDPQMTNVMDAKNQVRRSPVRQESILAEMAKRVRNHQGVSVHQQQKPPLIIVLTKADAWSFLLNEPFPASVYRKLSGTEQHALSFPDIEKTSADIRKMMQRTIPEIVSAAEQLSGDVTYIPVSATGGAPTIDPATGVLGFRPRDIKPMQIELPMLYSLAKLTRGIVPGIVKRT